MNRDRPRFPTISRRDFFRVGGVGIATYGLIPTLAPLNVQATRRVQPRGSAEFVIFYFLEGGASQLDTFDLKQGKWTPQDFDVRTVDSNLKMPYGLLPKLTEMRDKYAIVRSCEAWDSAHARAQYYIQVGHVFSPSRVKEMPGIGSIVAYETASKRKTSDFLPPFVAMNYDNRSGGLVGSGMLPATYTPMSIHTKGDLPFLLREEEKPDFERRRALLDRLDAPYRRNQVPTGRAMLNFSDFYSASYEILKAPQVSSIFSVSPEDRERYGSSVTGDACVIARNLVEADAGTRFIAIAHHGWDLHANAYDKQAKNNQYTLCWDLDAAFSSLLTDLEDRRDKEGRSLLEKTLIVVMGEFGRTTGELTIGKGRDHHRFASTALFAGAGVRTGQIIGATDEAGGKVVESGWHRQRSVYPEDVACTIYSALGIDWTKKITETPSGRAFYYIEDLSPVGPMEFDEVTELFT